MEKKVVRRGFKMTPAKRMKDFPGEFFERDEKMWCASCHCFVDHKESSAAEGHLNGKRHQEKKKKAQKRIGVSGNRDFLLQMFNN